MTKRTRIMANSLIEDVQQLISLLQYLRDNDTIYDAWGDSSPEVDDSRTLTGAEKEAIDNILHHYATRQNSI